MDLFGSQIITQWAGRAIPVLLGGAGGFLYYRFVGCKTGACLITSNPWISTLYGALIGFMVTPR